MRIEFEDAFYRLPVFRIFLVFHKVHERAVVNAVHSQSPHEISFHKPESLGQKQRFGSFDRNSVNDFAPEFLREKFVELFIRKSVFGPRCDVAAASRFGEPEPVIVPFCKRHRRIKPDDGEVFRYFYYGLNDLFADIFTHIVELRRIVPRHAGSVVSVIDVVGSACPEIDPFECDRRIAF